MVWAGWRPERRRPSTSGEGRNVCSGEIREIAFILLLLMDANSPAKLSSCISLIFFSFSTSQHPEAQNGALDVRLESIGRGGDFCQCPSARHHPDRGQGGTEGAELERHRLWPALVLALWEEQPYGWTSVVCYSLQRSRAVGHLREGSRKNDRAEACGGGIWGGHLSDSCLKGRKTRVRLKL